jgi:hypothetical protein
MAFRVCPTRIITIVPMPLTVFDIKGVPGHRRDLIEAAVVAGGKHACLSYEEWISADPFKGGLRLLVTAGRSLDSRRSTLSV